MTMTFRSSRPRNAHELAISWAAGDDDADDDSTAPNPTPEEEGDAGDAVTVEEAMGVVNFLVQHAQALAAVAGAISGYTDNQEVYGIIVHEVGEAVVQAAAFRDAIYISCFGEEAEEETDELKED